MAKHLSLLILLASALAAQPVRYEFRPARGARLTLTVAKTGLWSGRKHVFEFGSYRASVLFDRNAPVRSQVELTIDAESAVCRDTWVSDKDRRAILEFMLRDMLDAPHHPQLKFRSTSIAASAEKAFEVSGMLEVRGLERPATVSVTAEGLDGALAAVDGRAIVRLKDYGLKPPKAALGTIGTENEMKVEFHLAGSATTNSAGPSAQ